MSTYARFNPYDPEAMEFIKWLIGVANPQVTEFDATIEQDIEDISSAFSMWNEFRSVGPKEVTVHLTLRGYLPPGAEYTYSTEVPVQGALPSSPKALP